MYESDAYLGGKQRPDRSETKKALRKKRQAIVYAVEAARGNGVHPQIDDKIAELDADAEDMIVRKVNWLATPGGEVPATTAPELSYCANRIINTLTSQGETRIAEDASLGRMDLLLQNSLDCAPMALDAAQTIKADNSLDKMLAHQMAAAHEAAMRFLDRAMSCAFPRESVECTRYGNLAARFMAAYQDGLLVLHKIRGGGRSITVQHQHVNIGPNSQNVLGNVQTPGSRETGKTTKGTNE
jgi:hypothetical protein